jgi:hypothetical protein
MKNLINFYMFAFLSFFIISCDKKETAEKEDEKLVIPTNIQLGDFFAGGYVFYLKPDKSGGLVFAPSDASENTVPWGCKNLKLPVLGEKAGDGMKNTQTILSLCSETNIAAKICDLYVSAGFDDWFLPSKDELSMITFVCYEANSKVKLEHKLIPSEYYWSSTDSFDDMARVARGNLAVDGAKFRDEKHRVRAARAF